ncbi:MAG TPA: flagellar biosynthesis protein FlhF [Caldimonas sp.]|nr:flagellar biosynthesis protein FlhF [Caldimonas sp.]
MNVKRYTARTARDALALVRQALGDDAVVLSTKPTAGGVEVLAMAPESLGQVEQFVTAPAASPAAARASSEARSATAVPAPKPVPSNLRPERVERVEPKLDATSVEQDAAQLEMSTLSFQDYVRERMLKKRQAALAEDASGAAGAAPSVRRPATAATRSTDSAPRRASTVDIAFAADEEAAFAAALDPSARPNAPSPSSPEAAARTSPLLQDALVRAADAQGLGIGDGAARVDAGDMMRELRAMKGLIEERFGTLAFMEKLQRQPAQARLSQTLLDAGFSPALIRKLAGGLTTDVADEATWAAGILERNLATGEHEPALEDQGGVYALVGATGVGKTTTTAKIAAAFATKYGSGALGLVTLDAYRVGAHEQLRTYGRILGVPVHTAHDRASLEDLLELLAGKKMVLIDTAGMAQRDARTRELLDMLSHHAIRKVLVVSAASQGETIEDVLVAYGARAAAGIVLSKVDEAVKLAPAIDAMIRHRLKVVGIANGQRVPEDWHRLSAHALVKRALKGRGSSAYRLDADDVSLVFATPQSAARAALHA